MRVEVGATMRNKCNYIPAPRTSLGIVKDKLVPREQLLHGKSWKSKTLFLAYFSVTLTWIGIHISFYFPIGKDFFFSIALCYDTKSTEKISVFSLAGIQSCCCSTAACSTHWKHTSNQEEWNYPKCKIYGTASLCISVWLHSTSVLEWKIYINTKPCVKRPWVD